MAKEIRLPSPTICEPCVFLRAVTYTYCTLCTYIRRYCLVGIGVMLVGIVYWAAWRIVLPRIFGYELTPRKERLQDGTAVTLVSISPNLCLTSEFRILCVVFTPKGGLELMPNLSFFIREDFFCAVDYRGDRISICCVLL
jgi:hypothetical protein